jgi:hypothetical protein
MNIPQAPVAGFSPDQQTAFGNINAAQGQAQPYYNQAAGYFSPQGTQAFFNPYRDEVMAGLKDIFGQQNSQNTGRLTQAAGGIGADRIAVGQAELAKQQGLVAGQTLSGLYQNAAQQAQAAGQGQMALGQNVQNSALSGAQAQLYGGGLQQAQQQQQMNSPYQQQLAQAAFPYQQAQFLSGITGALAPGLGGTTSGQSQTTTPAPSLWSQILGGGAAVAGGLGQSGAFGSGGWLTGSNTTPTGATYGGYGTGSNGYGSLGGLQYPAFARGGMVNPFAGGGGVEDDPIDIAPDAIIPTGQIPQIQAHMPQLNFSQPSGGGGGGKGGGLGDIAKLAMMFVNRGGRVNPYASGGAVGYADGGEIDMYSPATFDERFPYRMPDDGVMDAWRSGAEPPAMAMAEEAPAVPQPRSRPAMPPVMAAGAEPQSPAMAFAEPEPRRGGAESFASSPWAALTAAGLGMMASKSPFVGTAIGEGGLQGMKVLEAQRANAEKARQQQFANETERLPYSQMTAYQKALVEAKGEKSTSGLFDDATVDMMADQYLAGDKSIFANLGRGAQGPENIAKLRTAIARKIAVAGGTGRDQAAAVANFGAQAQAAKTAAVRSANIDIAVEEARNTFPIALEASAAVPRTQWVPFNRMVQAVQAGTSSPQLARFVTANQAVITAYGQAMSRTGTNTVHAQESAERLLSTVTSPESYRAVIAQLEAEMQAAKSAPDAVRKEILSRISGRHDAGAAPAGARSKPPVVYQNGNEYRLQPDGSYR